MNGEIHLEFSENRIGAERLSSGCRQRGRSGTVSEGGAHPVWLALGALAVQAALAAEIRFERVEPDQAGFREAALDRWRDELARGRTTALVVVRDGKLVREWYAEGWHAARPHYTASTAKALVGGLSLLAAMQDGRLKPGDPASRHIPRWRADPRKSKITIRQVATHTSGIEDAELDGIPHDQLPGWKGLLWKRQPDPFTIALDSAPVMEAPGTRYRYSNPGMADLAYAVTASLRGAPQTDIRALLRERIYAPLEMDEDQWSIGYGRAYEVDGLRLYANWGGGNFTARAMARVGQLLAGGGEWKGKQLLSREWLARAAGYAGMPKPDRSAGERDPVSGLGFYTNSDAAWPGVPRDAVAASGAGNQFLAAIPSLGLVVCGRENSSAAGTPRGSTSARCTSTYWLP